MTIDKEQLRETVKDFNDFITFLENKSNCKIPMAWFLIEACEQYLTALDDGRVVEWLPIESAPRDGSSFLVFYSHGSIEKVKQWNDWSFEQSCDPSLKLTRKDATHWMVLPKPPTTERED